MSRPTVRVFDPDTKTIIRIPANNLPPGMIRARKEGEEDEFWIDPKEVKQNPICRHPPFPAEVRTNLARIQEVFHDVFPQTVEEWEDGFRRDRNPDQEIAIWLWMADMFEHFTAGIEPVYEKRKDIYDVILTFVNNGKDGVRHVMRKPVTLSARRFCDMLDYLAEQHQSACWEKYVRDATGRGAMTSVEMVTTISLHAIFAADGIRPNPAADPGWLLRKAEVIIGVDVMTQHEFLVYGRDTLEEIARGDQQRQPRTLRIELDQETDELERLCAVVQVVKGRHDYR